MNGAKNCQQEGNLGSGNMRNHKSKLNILYFHLPKGQIARQALKSMPKQTGKYTYILMTCVCFKYVWKHLKIAPRADSVLTNTLIR